MSKKKPTLSPHHFDVKRPDFDWEAICWRHGSWSARYRDIRDALKDACRIWYVDPLRLLSIACKRDLTERVVSIYLRRQPWRTREEILHSALKGRPTPARLRELIYYREPGDVKDIYRAADVLVKSLLDAGLLEYEDQDIEISPTGVAFGQKTLTKLMQRSQVKELVVRVLERVEAFNTDNDNLDQIVLIAIFGSYLDEETTAFGDLDIAYAFTRRAPPSGVEDWNAWLAQKYEQQFGEPFNLVLEIKRGLRRYHQLEHGPVIKALRANSRVSVHQIGDDAIFVENPKLAMRVIYEDGNRVSRETTASELVEQFSL